MPSTVLSLFLPPDLEFMEGLDVSKHGERALPVTAFVKELEASVHGGRKNSESPLRHVVLPVESGNGAVAAVSTH